jgi:hypothetical protein
LSFGGVFGESDSGSDLAVDLDRDFYFVFLAEGWVVGGPGLRLDAWGVAEHFPELFAEVGRKWV